MSRSPVRYLPFVGLLIAPLSVQAAGGHYAVDDAMVVAPGSCEIEAWYSRGDGDNQDYTAVPTCNPWGNLEIGLGASRVQDAGEWDTWAELNVKSIVRPFERGGYGWGIAAATSYGGAQDRVEGGVIYLPLSVHVAETLVMNYNLGWAYERDGDDAAIWG
ncbi:hypothetical protein CAI21_17640 [Alkalilimnicola ehrlichii]|uniref:Uncharacterized protein n=1 Tax=Alkalilimnicola ehrlichii TaxID=351052 RepID=A0A3E0WJN2_9GAMM|nr:hypothetical protein [Alkalilimnicola ehrlichii]RFA26153.1 hypothetical protein CAI21_17640 [Alkalilimnicola ehrlichii]RFA32351.1 hypothetical protein CAL65_19900 [Alkalilimnicola ehrlichii]